MPPITPRKYSATSVHENKPNWIACYFKTSFAKCLKVKISFTIFSTN